MKNKLSSLSCINPQRLLVHSSTLSFTFSMTVTEFEGFTEFTFILFMLTFQGKGRYLSPQGRKVSNASLKAANTALLWIRCNSSTFSFISSGSSSNSFTISSLKTKLNRNIELQWIYLQLIWKRFHLKRDYLLISLHMAPKSLIRMIAQCRLLYFIGESLAFLREATRLACSF